MTNPGQNQQYHSAVYQALSIGGTIIMVAAVIAGISSAISSVVGTVEDVKEIKDKDKDPYRYQYPEYY